MLFLRLSAAQRSVRSLALVSATLVLGSCAPDGAEPIQADLLIRGGTVYDGSGGEPRRADVAILEDRIVFVGDAEETLLIAAEILDATGLAVTPGFIDMHSHAELSEDYGFDGAPFLFQGITTVVLGLDGGGTDEVGRLFRDWTRRGIGVNALHFVGHGYLRRTTLGFEDRAPSPDELDSMMARVRRAMEEGAFGLSSGLEYDPGFYSSTGELIALSRASADAGGFYMSHMRDEEEGLLDAVAEAIRVGREAGLPVQISHIKAGNASVWGKASEVLDMIAAANSEGLDVTADQYPYTAWQSGLAIVVRSRQFQNPDSVAAGIAAIGGGERLQIVLYSAEPEFNGLRLSEIAEQKMEDLNAVDIEGATNIIAGTARSMGLVVEG